MFHAEEHCSSVLPSMGVPWAVNPDCLRFLPYAADRHHGHLTPTTACWLISRSIIIGHFPLRSCLPQTGCTPAFPLGSLDAIFFTAYRSENLTKCCRSVPAPRLRLLKWLMYLNCWIWLAEHIVILCLLSELDTRVSFPAFVKVP